MGNGKKKIPGIPGTFDVPILGNHQRGIPRTVHLTEFQGCKIGVEYIVNEEHKVLHYRLKILDMGENHLYHFDLDEKLRQDMIQMLMEVPLIGTTPGEPE